MCLKYFILPIMLVACGTNGKDGVNGVAGKDGKDGRDGVAGQVGSNGKDGVDGKDGADGKDFAVGLREAYSKVLKAADSVLDMECLEPAWRGTGTKLANGDIVTAYHVMYKCEAMAYYSKGSLVGSGGEYTSIDDRDIAIVSKVKWNAVGQALPGLSMTKKTGLQVGDVTFTASLPADLAQDVQVAMGFVTDDSVSTAVAPWSRAFTTDAAASGGSSGAPVFDMQGNWFGIHVGGWNDGGLELNIQLLF